MSASSTRPNGVARWLRVALAIGALITAGIITFGCGAASPPEGVPGISGTVTEVETTSDGNGTILVEGPRQPEGAVSDKAQVTVNDGTRYFDADGEPLSETPQFTVGTRVSVWFIGPIAESYPVQGTAAAVQLVD